MLKTLLSKKPYLISSLAMLASGIGTAFTAVAVYAELENQSAGQIYYSIAFCLAILPGLITSHFAPKLIRNMNLSKLISAAMVLAAVCQILPLTAEAGDLASLVFAETVGSSVTGLLIPVLGLYKKRSFLESELQAASTFETYSFTGQFLLGQLFGSLIFSSVGKTLFFSLDITTYIIGAALVLWANKLDPSGFEMADTSSSESSKFNWGKLSQVQKKSFLLLPLLGFVCAPLMALLPVKGQDYAGTSIALIASPTLLLLISKSIGQLLGPMLIIRIDVEKLFRKDSTILFLLLGFLSLYFVVFNTNVFLVACLAVSAAHICSNVIFVYASLVLTKEFGSEIIAEVYAKNYQLNVLVMSAASIFGGYLAQSFSTDIFFVYSGICFVIAILIINKLKNKSEIEVTNVV